MEMSESRGRYALVNRAEGKKRDLDPYGREALAVDGDITVSRNPMLLARARFGSDGRNCLDRSGS